MRDVTRAFGMSVSTVSLWCARAQGQRLDCVDFEGDKPGLAMNRLADGAERGTLSMRTLLKASVLGEYGAVAIRRALSESSLKNAVVPSRAAIHRVLLRNGAVDSARRLRRPPPPKGWYLPEVAQGREPQTASICRSRCRTIRTQRAARSRTKQRSELVRPSRRPAALADA